MKRREMLAIGIGTVASFLAGNRSAFADLEPDRFWSIYRRYRLMILGQRDDEIGIALAQSVVGVLAGFLPATRAELARAPDARRIGVLMATNQQDVAILTGKSAEALFLSKAPFDDVRDLPLRIIVSFQSHVLICRSDFIARDAYLLAQTLAAHGDTLPIPAAYPEGIVVPAHPGSHAFFAGEAIPNAPNTA
jgi:hypothetical protein